MGLAVAIDTANKRFSIADLGYIEPMLMPVPDGGLGPLSPIGTQDRAHMLALYAGLVLGAAVAPSGPWTDVTAASGTWTNTTDNAGVWTPI